jgi:hypothetical protein
VPLAITRPPTANAKVGCGVGVGGGLGVATGGDGATGLLESEPPPHAAMHMAPAIKAGPKTRKVGIAHIVEPGRQAVNDADGNEFLNPYE